MTLKVVKVDKKLPLTNITVTLYECYEDEENIESYLGCFELDDEDDEFFLYLDHVRRPPWRKGESFLPRVIDHIFESFKFEKLLCLPLEKYRPYYEKLGFKIYKQIGDDIYYYKEKGDT